MIVVHLFFISNNTAKQYSDAFSPSSKEVKCVFRSKYLYLLYVLYSCIFRNKKWHIIFHDIPSKILLIIVKRLRFNNYSWVVWGSDLYDLLEKNPKYAKSFIRNCSAVYGFTEDFIQISKLGPLGRTQEFHYLPPTVLTYLKEQVQLKATKNQKNILLGHSCSEGNNLMRLPFDELNKQDCNYYVILSYGCDLKKAHDLKAYLSSKLSSVVFVEDYLSLEGFTNWLAKNVSGLYLFNDRQAAVGNIAICLLLGIPVFMKPKVAPFALFNSIGRGVYDLERIQEKEHLSLEVEVNKFNLYYQQRVENC